MVHPRPIARRAASTTIAAAVLTCAAVHAHAFCIVEAAGCRDASTGRLYVYRGDRLVDPDSGRVYSDATAPPPALPSSPSSPSSAPSTADADATDAELHGIYQTASASGRVFHHMVVQPDGGRRVRVELLLALTVAELPGCTGGGVTGTGVPDARRHLRLLPSSASASAAAAPSCRIDIAFDPDWGAADVRARGCEAVHGGACSFAGRYVRVRRLPALAVERPGTTTPPGAPSR